MILETPISQDQTIHLNTKNGWRPTKRKMIEAVILKLCFDEGQLQEYMEQQNKVATVIHASYDEEEERDCYFVRIEQW